MKKGVILTILLFSFPPIITAQVNFSEPIIISESFSPRVPKCIVAFDIDSDTDMDLLVNSYGGELGWYENVNGKGTFSNFHVIDKNSTQLGLSVEAGFLNSDSKLDVISTIDGDASLIWYENKDGKGTFDSGKIISELYGHPNCVCLFDVDNDKDTDLLIISIQGEVVWFENTSGQGTFSEAKSINKNQLIPSEYIDAVDLDGDNDLDVIVFGKDKVVWYENLNGLGSFSQEKIITQSINDITSGFIVDCDKDGLLDIIIGAWNRIIWLKNNNGSFSHEKIVSNNAGDISAVYGADLDNDKDIDLLATSRNGNIIWYKNTDSQCNFSSPIIINSLNNRYGSVLAIDTDSDSDLDVVASYNDNRGLAGKIEIYENLINLTSIQENQSELQNSFHLHQNYPNPFNPSTVIKYHLNKANNVEIKICNLAGQEIETLINGFQAAGQYEITWQPKGLPSGLYFYRLQAGEFSETKKLLLQK